MIIDSTIIPLNNRYKLYNVLLKASDLAEKDSISSGTSTQNAAASPLTRLSCGQAILVTSKAKVISICLYL